MNTMSKFQGDWVRIEEVMENTKNRQMWDLWLQKMEFRNMENGIVGFLINFEGKQS